MMTSYSTFVNWDFVGDGDGSDIWNIGNNRNNDYPYLDWQFPDEPPTLPVELSSFTVTSTSQIPFKTSIKGIYPNPFSNTAILSYSVGKSSPITIKIYNARGQIVRCYDEGTKSPDTYKLTWDGRDTEGDICATGNYIFRLISEGEVHLSKVILQK